MGEGADREVYLCVCMRLEAYEHAYGHEYTVVMLKQPGHLTSMKKELGDCTRRLSLCRRCSSSLGGCSRSTSPMEMKLMVEAKVDAEEYICENYVRGVAFSHRLGFTHQSVTTTFTRGLK